MICALQYAGNRRHTMRTNLIEVDGVAMNRVLRGSRLCELLRGARVLEVLDEKARERACEDGWYGASILLSRALDEDADVVLALRMNDATLPTKHGGPVRVVVRGVADARTVKWVDRIMVQMVESANIYQMLRMRRARGWWWYRTPALLVIGIDSVVGVLVNGRTVWRDKEGMVAVKGHALPSGSNAPVEKVEVSVDEGMSWVETEILEVPEKVKGRGRLLWAWSLWTAKVKMEKGEKTRILSRATDGAGVVRLEVWDWDLRRFAYNGYGEASDLTVR
ncbi:hypothetical protein W97_02153 [Coniosporium apollinis CBS 100218]|uniref:Moybdenum cofactor oxidoreductase dimerisation domain-containing protein n=1 Tax=Coniosporium apollinis (strain CBS 100218) TaxID=1168221 RepID=R7YLY5_CONA1|nr:uncharacterized protein W97_02153 [Coniosporium apollinis CBS 100218]EON62927.1 hypothetical protein W97_02153 [Coniosporium apollinis CBS 100218]